MIPKNIERRIRQHVQAKKNDFFAIVQPGFEETALREITHNCPDITDTTVMEGGIAFNTNIKNAWALNFISGCLTRILLRIEHFRVLYFEKLQAKISAIPWELYLMPGILPDISVKCRHSRLYHTGRIKEECLKGIRLHMEKIYPSAAYAETGTSVSGNQTVYIRIEDDICTVSIDMSGEPLYRRGFRTHITEAPLRETLAACILHETDTGEFDAVLDPMCGSGVIPLEALLISRGIPPGANRHFAFEDWPGHRERAFEFIKKESTEKNKSESRGYRVYASDMNEKAVEITQDNFRNSGFTEGFSITRADFFSLKREDFPEKKLLITFNPPYGERINVNDIEKLYRRIGGKLRKDFSGTLCAVIVPGAIAEKALGILPQKRIQFINGGIRVILIIGYC